MTTEFSPEALKEREAWTDQQWKDKYGTMWESMKSQDTFLRLPPDEQKRVREAQAMVLAEKKTALDKIKVYSEMDEIQKRFKKLLGDAQGQAYVESVVIAVSKDEKLQECTPKSIMIQAMRAASLGLSLDPILEQAYLIAYGNEATLIPDYRGLVQLSVNTVYYEYAPNVSEVWQGEEVNIDRFTGKVTITGERVNNVIIGWMAYSKAKNGTERWLYMTNEECDQHGKTYNPGGYNSPKSPWNAHNGRDRDKMRRKTVLRTFVRKWGNFSPKIQQFMMQDEPAIEAEFEDLPSDENIVIPEKDPDAEKHVRTAEQNLKELGFGG